ncbi:PemK-like protein [Candidatus Magnetobacterium bavaricum]|uniref:PemK-like protein n=1 Tax=Candidatus Magnetobacterium bavaricum TaxID=29290 RepID=A0A0F3H411_9BACT|nr:PemK-like protein [Candidatus Magnetobacterium bavaricum]
MSKRPAMVVYDSGDMDIVVARITTQEYTTGTDYKIKNWHTCGLIMPSYVRLSKLATIEKNHVLKKLAVLGDNELEDIRVILKSMLKLSG